MIIKGVTHVQPADVELVQIFKRCLKLVAGGFRSGAAQALNQHFGRCKAFQRGRADIRQSFDPGQLLRFPDQRESR